MLGAIGRGGLKTRKHIKSIVDVGCADAYRGKGKQREMGTTGVQKDWCQFAESDLVIFAVNLFIPGP